MDDPLQLFTDPTNITPLRLGTFLATESNEAVSTEDNFLVELLDAEASKRIPTRVSLNGIDLSEFGIIVTQCYNTVLKLSAVKPLLVSSSDRRNGVQVFFPQNSTYEAKQIIIECYMLSDSLIEFYHNYEALFNNLTLKQEIEIGTLQADSKCFYNSMTDFVKHKAFATGVRISFKLKLTCIDTGLLEFLLSAQSGDLITTEDNFCIEL